MNKSELIEQIAKRSKLPLTSSRKALEALMDAVGEALASGDRVQLVGFGTFKVTQRAAREGRNPQTREVINIPATKTPSFSAGAELKKKVNGRS
ncbi:MAG: HU family DNA-binding protein [Succinivibrio sp.]|nr:HU family DNA-binding protein [Succinivibrio sp.]